MELKPGGIKIRHALLILPAVLFLQFVYGIIVAAIASIVHYPFEKDLVLLGLINVFSIGLVIFLCMLIYRLPWRRVFPLRRTPFIIYPVLTLTVFGLDIMLSEVDNILRFFFQIKPDPAILNGIHFSPWGAALTLVAIAPLTEEALFRGLLLQGFQKQYSNKIAILVSAVLFGAIHLNWQQIPGAAILGLLLGWAILKTGSILPCLFIHGLNNGLVLLAMRFNFHIPGFSNGPSATTGAVFQPIWFDALGILLFAAGFWLLNKVLKAPQDQQSAPTVALGTNR